MAEIYERNDRGFHGYGRQPLTCSYKGRAEVYESSAAGEPHVWLKVQDGAPIRADSAEGVAFLHMNAETVRDLIDRLQTWLTDRAPSDHMQADHGRRCSCGWVSPVDAKSWHAHMAWVRRRAEVRSTDVQEQEKR